MTLIQDAEKAVSEQNTWACVALSADFARALIAAGKLADTGATLDKAVTEVIALGAQTGPQWTRLTSANLKHRTALAAFRQAVGGES